MQRYLDPTNDVAFKKLFSDKIKLIDLLNCVLRLPEGYKITDLDYIPTEQMPLYFEAKSSIFDLKVKDEQGRWYIVEMQRKMKKDYLNRAQYYGCHSYISQLEKGIGHKDLLPVVVVSIIGTKALPDELPYINYHHLKESTTHKQYLFSVTYVFIELGKFDENQIKDDTDQWLHLLKCAASEREPPEEIKNDKVLLAYGELEQYKWNAAEHDAYIRSRLAQEAEEIRFEDIEERLQEAQSELQEAQSELQETQSELQETQSELQEAQSELQEAQTELQKAQAQLQEAQILAEAKVKRELIKMMLNNGNSIETIASTTGLSVEEIQKFK